MYAADNGPAALVIILASSMLALAYNLVHNFLLQRTSSVTVTVLGEVKIVGLLVLSAMFLPGACACARDGERARGRGGWGSREREMQGVQGSGKGPVSEFLCVCQLLLGTSSCVVVH